MISFYVSLRDLEDCVTNIGLVAVLVLMSLLAIILMQLNQMLVEVSQRLKRIQATPVLTICPEKTWQGDHIIDAEWEPIEQTTAIACNRRRPIDRRIRAYLQQSG